MGVADNPSERMCFACGPDNPIGLQIAFTCEDGVCRGRFTPGEFHVGYNDTAVPPARDALFRNEGGTRFVEVAGELGVVVTGVTRQPSFIDFDGDGDVDLFVALRDQPNRLFENVGGRFVDVTEASGIGDPRRTVGVVRLKNSSAGSPPAG